MKQKKTYIWINAALFCSYGFGFLLFPESLSLIITDSSPANSPSLIDMRANYGGVSFGFGLLLIYCAQNYQLIKTGILGIIFTVGGMAVGRSIGIFSRWFSQFSNVFTFNARNCCCCTWDSINLSKKGIEYMYLKWLTNNKKKQTKLTYQEEIQLIFAICRWGASCNCKIE